MREISKYVLSVLPPLSLLISYIITGVCDTYKITGFPTIILYVFNIYCWYAIALTPASISFQQGMEKARFKGERDLPNFRKFIDENHAFPPPPGVTAAKPKKSERTEL